jgi:MerR family transcriptional regulator, light-induced transcriptional regulator
VTLYRIGTAARLSGLPIATLRNWEQRYGDVRAARSDGRQRLYSRDDIDLLRQLKEWVDGGLSAGEAHALLRDRASRGVVPSSEPSGHWVREEARRVRAAAAAAHARAAAERARSAEVLEALGVQPRRPDGD